jgi:hypothetical protein
MERVDPTSELGKILVAVPFNKPPISIPGPIGATPSARMANSSEYVST